MNQSKANCVETNQNKLSSFTIKMLNECSSSKLQELEDKILYKGFVVHEVILYFVSLIYFLNFY